MEVLLKIHIGALDSQVIYNENVVARQISRINQHWFNYCTGEE